MSDEEECKRTKYKYVPIKKLPTKCIDVSTGDKEYSLDMKITEPHYIRKRYSRSVRKNIKRGLFMPIDSKPTKIVCYPQLKVKETDDDVTILPLYFKSNKYKNPCGTTVNYFKNYLQFIKGLDDIAFMHHVKFSFSNPDKTIEKIASVVTKKQEQTHTMQNQVYKYISNCIMSNFHNTNGTKRTVGIHLLPIIKIKCPCSILGGSQCNKLADILTFIFINFKSNATFMNWIVNNFIKPVTVRYIKLKKVVDVTFILTQKGKNHTRFAELRVATCHSCITEQVCINHKITKTNKPHKKTYGVKLRYTYNTICRECSEYFCSECGNDSKNHSYVSKRSVCPPRVTLSKPTTEELAEIQKAFDDEKVETSKCPKCNNLVTKDENCDKVKCGSVSGVSSLKGCGTQFCFRCGEDISHLKDNYLDHLITTMKPDGSMTTWICKKFCKKCPECDAGQYWDGKSDKIKCGSCHNEFDVDKEDCSTAEIIEDVKEDEDAGVEEEEKEGEGPIWGGDADDIGMNELHNNWVDGDADDWNIADDHEWEPIDQPIAGPVDEYIDLEAPGDWNDWADGGDAGDWEFGR